MKSGAGRTSEKPSAPTSAIHQKRGESSRPSVWNADDWAGLALLVLLMIVGFASLLI